MSDVKRYPDSIETSSGRVVRVSALDKDKVIQIGPNRVKVRVGDIKYTSVRLSCGDVTRGIALLEGNVLWCEKHEDNVFVSAVLNG